MRFLSVQSVFDGFLKVIRRFPLESSSAVVATVSLITLIEREAYPQQQADLNLIRVAVCCWLGLTLFLSATLYIEKNKVNTTSAWGLRALVLAFIITYFFLLDPELEVDLIRFAFLIVGAHLLVSFAAFTGKNQVESFWEFNKILFIRILTAGLYSTVLFAGISIAMASSDVLFDLSIDGKSYGQLSITIYGIFNTIFFLAGIPEEISPDDRAEYPKGLRVFTQFVLIPLAIVYLAILLAYESKLIIQWSLPKGLVGSLVLGYAVFGILAILLVHPIRNNTEHVWINTFTKWFYRLLIPLICLLAIAIWIRVDAYGITESRYVVIMLSLWLTGITTYFIVSKNKSIKTIPITLCLITLISTWGPQSASSVSKLSQVARLVKYFDEQQAIQNGKLVPLKERSDEVRDVAQFLMRRYGNHVMQPLISISIDSIYTALDATESHPVSEYNVRQQVLDYLGLDESLFPAHEYFTANSMQPLDISGFSEMILIKKQASDGELKVDYERRRDHDAEIKIYSDSTSVWIMYDSIEVRFDATIIFNLARSTSDSTKSNYVMLPSDRMFVDSDDRRLRLALESVYFKWINDEQKYRLESCRGYLLLR